PPRGTALSIAGNTCFECQMSDVRCQGADRRRFRVIRGGGPPVRAGRGPPAGLPARRAGGPCLPAPGRTRSLAMPPPAPRPDSPAGAPPLYSAQYTPLLYRAAPRRGPPPLRP